MRSHHGVKASELSSIDALATRKTDTILLVLLGFLLFFSFLDFFAYRVTSRNVPISASAGWSCRSRGAADWLVANLVGTRAAARRAAEWRRSGHPARLALLGLVSRFQLWRRSICPLSARLPGN